MKPMYHILGILVAAFQHSLCKASTATCPSRHSHLCPACHPPSPSSALTQGAGRHTTSCWPSLEPRKLFKAKTVPPSRRWFWLLRCLLSPYKTFNSFPTFPSLEGEHISTWKDKKARGSRSHGLHAFSYTLSHSLPYLCTRYPRSQ